MELEDLKSSWSELNKQLEKNELLNKRIIQEMITKRTQTAYNKLLRFDIAGLVLTIAAILFILLMELYYPRKTEILLLVSGVVIFGLFTGLRQLHYLLNFNIFNMKVYELNRIMLSYRLFVKRSSLAGCIIAPR